MKQKNKYFNKTKLSLLFLLLVSIILSAITITIARDSREIGRGLGNKYGELIGNMKGSMEGNKKGEEEGKIAAKIPEVPTVEIEQKIREQGKLHVMEVSMEITDIMKKGEGKDTKLALLISKNATANYSVDLSCITIKDDENGIILVVPDIEANIIEENQPYKILDEYIGKNEYSEIAYKLKEDSEASLNKKIQLEFNQEGTIKVQAREVARKQIEDLAKTLSGKKVSVEFSMKGCGINE